MDAADRAAQEQQDVRSKLHSEECPCCGNLLERRIETRDGGRVMVLSCKSPYHATEVVIRR